MKLSFRRIAMPVVNPFTTASGTTTLRHSVLVAVEHGGARGLGEAAPARSYGQTPDSVVAALPAAAVVLANADPFAFEDTFDRLVAAMPGQWAAVAAVDCAVHDLAGRLSGLPVWRRLGVSRERMPVTSFTIGIDSLEMIERKIAAAGDWPVLKIKLGTDADEAIVQTVRRCTSVPIRVDANCGWSVERARQMCRWLAGQGVELIEQPLPRGCEADLAALKADSPLPIYADESCHVASDVPALAGCVHGVNLKLSKAGGITGGLRLIHAARSAGLRVMVGCMLESSIAMAAAAQLAPLCDEADLDGHLLLAEDTATGLDCRAGRLVLSDKPGLGLEERPGRHAWTPAT